METQKINGNESQKGTSNNAKTGTVAMAGIAAGMVMGAKGAALVKDPTEPIEVPPSEVEKVQEKQDSPLPTEENSIVEDKVEDKVEDNEVEGAPSDDEPQPIVTPIQDTPPYQEVHEDVLQEEVHENIQQEEEYVDVQQEEVQEDAQQEEIYVDVPNEEVYEDVSDEDIVDVIDHQVIEIDPDDIDRDPLISINEIGTVYTVDGESLLAAAIQDPDGNDLLMVDVDGDNVFDVVTTYDGEIITEINGDIDISDAEHLQSDDYGYLAANDFDQNLDPGSEIQQDLIETT